jgi:hypothetical protein
MEHTDTRELPRSIPIREDLNPGDTEWLVEEEKKSGLEGNTIIFDSYSDAPIVASKLFETDGSGDCSIICSFTLVEFLPFFPSSDTIGHPGDEWPEYECPEEEHEKYFHDDSVSDFPPLQWCKRGGYYFPEKDKGE